MFSFLYNLSDRQKDKKENYLCCMRNEIETKKSPSRHNPLTDLLFMAKKEFRRSYSLTKIGLNLNFLRNFAFYILFVIITIKIILSE